jgi:hypothetical protein
MTVSIEDESWRDGEQVDGVVADLVSFLRDNSESAFTVRELADEIMETSWERAHEEERERQRLGEDEFEDRRAAGEYDGRFETSFSDTIMDQIDTTRLVSALDQLLADDVIEARTLPADETDIPYEDFGPVVHYTYSNG